jgi:hypothetical protein
MSKPKRVDEVFIFVVRDDDGGEGMPASSHGSMTFALIGADPAGLDSFRRIGRQMATQLRRPIRLLRFSRRTEVEVFEPESEGHA